MPRVEWKEENRRFSLCFFPLVGVVVGGIFLLWFYVCESFGIGKILFSAFAAAVPVTVTGGIHIDGFCDVCDAKASLGSREEMFGVMKDSRVGAFAVIDLAVYFLVQIGIFSEVNNFETALICSLGFVLSRAWSGLAAVTFKSAKSKGTLQSFAKPSHRRITVLTEIFYIVTILFLMLFINFRTGIFSFLGSVLIFIYYRIFSYRKFGGITGDLAGYFLQLCELFTMLFAVAAEVLF